MHIFVPSIYRSRRPRASPLWQIVHHAWNDFLAQYEACHRKIHGPLRGDAVAVVEQFYRCGDPRKSGSSSGCTVSGRASSTSRRAISHQTNPEKAISQQFSYQDGAKELYDHRSDPDEFHDLADDPAHQATLKKLAEWLPKKAAPEFKTKSERSRVRKK